MSTLRFALVLALMAPTIAFAQSDPNNIPEPPTAELKRLAPYLGSYAVVSNYFDMEWRGTLDLRPAVKGWYVEWEINVQSGPIDRQLKMFITWDRDLEYYRVWSFSTTPPDPKDRDYEGIGRFEGEEFVIE